MSTSKKKQSRNGTTQRIMSNILLLLMFQTLFFTLIIHSHSSINNQYILILWKRTLGSRNWRQVRRAGAKTDTSRQQSPKLDQLAHAQREKGDWRNAAASVRVFASATDSVSMFRTLVSVHTLFSSHTIRSVVMRLPERREMAT